MKIILFDGVCNFCNSTVNFILKRDKDKVFHFAPLQSEKGKELISKIHYAAPKVPIITSVKDFVDNNKNKALANMLSIDMLSSDIYTMGYEFEPYANLDYRAKLITK